MRRVGVRGKESVRGRGDAHASSRSSSGVTAATARSEGDGWPNLLRMVFSLSSSSSASLSSSKARPGASQRTLASWRASGRGRRRLKVWASWTQGGGGAS